MKWNLYGVTDASLYGKGLWRSLVAAGSACALAATMAAPTTALAAESLTVVKDLQLEGETHIDAASGEGWAWDGDEALELNNFDGAYIGGFGGSLNVTATGTNNVDSLYTFNGDLSITGAGDDAVINTSGTGNNAGIYTNQDLDISNIELNIHETTRDQNSYEWTGMGTPGALRAGGDVSLDKVSGTLEISGEADEAAGVLSEKGTVAIKDSNLNIDVKTAGGTGISASEGSGDIKINNSSLDIDAPGAAIDGSNLELTDAKVVEGGQVAAGSISPEGSSQPSSSVVIEADDPSAHHTTGNSTTSASTNSPSEPSKSGTGAVSTSTSTQSSDSGKAPASAGSVAAAATTAPAAVASAVSDAAQTPKTADSTTAPFAAVCAFASAAMMAMAVRMRKETLGKHIK